jgi:ubiquinone/menaquinone biosynthesis C-methylase UbiE
LLSNIVEYYSKSLFEDGRLEVDFGGNIEWIRTIDIFERFLPHAPCTVLDVGGGTGVYALWLLLRGYEVDLVDIVPTHVQAAKQKLGGSAPNSKWTASVGDAINMDFPDSSMDIVLLMGPLYHAQKSDERLSILHEAKRVLKPGGYLFCTIISRFASFLDGLVSGFIRDPEFRQIVEGDLQNSCHNNHTDRMEYFTTAYFQHPDELRKELIQTGFADIRLIGVEGLLWASMDWKSLRRDKDAWEASLEFMRVVESDNSVIGTSPHIMGIGKKPSE